MLKWEDTVDGTLCPLLHASHDEAWECAELYAEELEAKGIIWALHRIRVDVVVVEE